MIALKLASGSTANGCSIWMPAQDTSSVCRWHSRFCSMVMGGVQWQTLRQWQVCKRKPGHTAAATVVTGTPMRTNVLDADEQEGHDGGHEGRHPLARLPQGKGQQGDVGDDEAGGVPLQQGPGAHQPSVFRPRYDLDLLVRLRVQVQANSCCGWSCSDGPYRVGAGDRLPAWTTDMLSNAGDVADIRRLSRQSKH
jgi:hypothetical protein